MFKAIYPVFFAFIDQIPTLVPDKGTFGILA
jgi:hypothetical protein